MRAFLWGRKMPLPNILEFIGTNITQRKFQEAQEKLLNYLGIEVPTKTELNSEISKLNNAITPKADKIYVDANLTAISGGHKAYQTLALAQSAQGTLPVNTIVEVTNDPTASNNGTYQWNGTTLTKSAYDPLTQAKNFAITEDKIVKDISVSATYKNTDSVTSKVEPISGGYVDGTGAQAVISSATAQYLKIDVSNADFLTVSGTTATFTAPWIFRDANDALVQLSGVPYGDVNLLVPPNAKWAYRTFKTHTGLTESANMSIKLTYKSISKQIADGAGTQVKINSTNAVSETIPTSDWIWGASVNTNLTGNILNYSGSAEPNTRAFIRFDVSKYKSIVVKNSVILGGTGAVLFVDANHVKISKVNTENTTVAPKEITVPPNAKWAFRTVYFNDGTTTVTESGSLNITGKFTTAPMYYQILQNARRIDYAGLLVQMMEKELADGKTLKIEDFVGATQHDQIEATINFIRKRGWGILELSSGIWLRNSAVLLPSNCWIYLNNATLKLADGVFDNVIRNDGIVPDADPFKVASQLNENVNIRVFGTGKTFSFVEGATVPYSAPHPIDGGDPVQWVGDWYGWRAISILFANVKNYKLHDFGMRYSNNWSISNEHGCEDFEFYNLDFFTQRKNGDGIDLRMGCKNGVIRNITGNTNDDLIALTALKGFSASFPDGSYIYPSQVGGFYDRGFGVDIQDVRIFDVSGRGQNHGVRVLASGGSKQKNISIDNVSDSDGSLRRVVIVSTGYGTNAVMGDISNITVNNIESHHTDVPLYIQTPIKDSSFNKIRQYKTGESAVTHQLGNIAVLENTEITNAVKVV